MDTLKELLALLGFGPENIQATLYISLAAVLSVQLLKKRLTMVPAELLAAIAGAVVGACLWVEPVKGVVVGVILGGFWTLAYKPFMRYIVYKNWPDLEEKMSAKPQKAVQTPRGVVVRDADAPSGPDEKTLFVGAPTEAPDTTVPKSGIKPEPSNE